MQALITVVIPVYNGEKYVERAAMSILNQPRSEYIELIIVNDGSKDRSGEIIDRLAEEHENVRVFHKENGGVSSARNLGLENAHGKYLAFADADDWWEPNFFDDGLCRELNRTDEIDLYSFAYRLVSYDMRYGKVYTAKEMEKRFNEPCQKDKDFDTPPHAVWMFRRDFLIDNGLRYLNTANHEDMPLVEVSLFLALSVKSINKLMYNYYMNQTSCVHTSNAAKKMNEILKALQIKKLMYEERGFDREGFIERETISETVELLPMLCVENNLKTVLEFVNSERLAVLKDDSIKPWAYLQKRWSLWKKHPKIFWLISRLHPGLALSLKSVLYKMSWSRRLADHLFLRFVRKWHRI